jgi:two-component system sensor histidine kinase DegS
MATESAAAPMTRSHARPFGQQFRLRLRDRRFWIVQALVITISLGHTALEATHHLGALPDLGLLPVSTYFIPVVYAALNFGVEGAVPTALWCSAMTIPNLILWHTPAQRPGVILQLVLLVVIAYVIARRVNFETAAKEHAEAANVGLERAQRALEDYVRLATDAQEEERKRLARELHDDTIQTLLVAKTELDAITSEQSVPPRAAARLKKVDATLATAIDDVRRFSRDLRPSLLDDLGLVHAIDWLVADLTARTGIDAHLKTSGKPRRLDQRNELALFRIIQEALHNVERHADASSVEVRIELGDGVHATVTDDGHGFDVHKALDGNSPSEKLGLLGMRERAKLAGAELSITSQPPSGTSVSISLGPRA